MKIIDQVLQRKELQEYPPVLIDIGASGAIHDRWKTIAPYSICITFEPDTRKFDYIQQESKNYKKLYKFYCGAGSQDSEDCIFYLTHSPYCSSFLRPDTEKLQPYSFADKFIVEEETRYPVKSICNVLEELHIHYVDWYKSDSQGWDLRIFSAMGDSLIRKVKVAEFEPGIMDAYEGEDKLHQVLSFMEHYPFFLSRLDIKGVSRISPQNLNLISDKNIFQKIIAASHKPVAGWGEMVYINTFEDETNLPAGNAGNIRDYLLDIVIAMLNGEYGLSLELSQKASTLFHDPIFKKLEDVSIRKIRNTIWNLRFLNEVKKPAWLAGRLICRKAEKLFHR